MPNTLAHIGFQVPFTRLGVVKEAPLQWIALGCIIPDIPWILQRVLERVPTIDPVTLRLYAVFQASLFSCAVLSLFFALLTRKTAFIFLLLVGNCLLHLLLDACQIKWGNGVNLFLPFSWHVTGFAFFWPEDFPSYLLTALGVPVLVFSWKKAVKADLFLQKPNTKKAACLACLLLVYFLTPLFFINGAYDADMHYSQTISDKQTRTGKTVEIDRARYNSQTQILAAYADKNIHLTTPPPVKGGKLSVKGVFTGADSLTITEYHRHNSFRDYASYVGLFSTLFLFIFAGYARK
ncbi:MAG: hypothetical protein DSY80_04620 [Desulfocapsa sp.]|nr:MAG: hypothetical protein DSY80_04620 [Desulfocapsa sp.]